MLKILIVEDEVGPRNGIAALIAESGLPCTVVGLAEDGYDGMLKAKSLSPDLIITDIKMPRVDGLAMMELAGETGLAEELRLFQKDCMALFRAGDCLPAEVVDMVRLDRIVEAYEALITQMI